MVLHRSLNVRGCLFQILTPVLLACVNSCTSSRIRPAKLTNNSALTNYAGKDKINLPDIHINISVDWPIISKLLTPVAPS